MHVIDEKMIKLLVDYLSLCQSIIIVPLVIEYVNPIRPIWSFWFVLNILGGVNYLLFKIFINDDKKLKLTPKLEHIKGFRKKTTENICSLQYFWCCLHFFGKKRTKIYIYFLYFLHKLISKISMGGTKWQIYGNFCRENWRKLPFLSFFHVKLA